MKQYHHAILASKGSSNQYFKYCHTMGWHEWAGSPHRFRNSVIPVESNNSTAVAYKQNGGTVYINPSPLTKTLLLSAREYNIIAHSIYWS